MSKDYIAFYPEIDPKCKYCGGKGYLTGPNVMLACSCGKEPEWVKKEAKRRWGKKGGKNGRKRRSMD